MFRTLSMQDMDIAQAAHTCGQNADDADVDASKELLTAIQLPCGCTVPNRLVKVAMYEHMSNFYGGPPNEAHFELYSRWSKGEWGMICTGNVQVSKDHLTLGRDMVVPEHITPETVEPFKRLADAIHGEAYTKAEERDNKPLAIMQLSHPGRQSASILGGRWPFVPPLAPSAVPVGRTRRAGTSAASSLLSYILLLIFFQIPRCMSIADIDEVVDAFVRGARLASESGFDGIELHAAHGYLISQFISSKTNLRDDEYSAHSDPLRLLRRIVSAIRGSSAIVGDFVVGIKLNAADYVEEQNSDNPSEFGQAQEDRAMQHLREIASWNMVDYIQVSGGDYEDPAFMIKTKMQFSRQALFTRFAHEAVQALSSTSSEQFGGNAPTSAACNGRPLPLVMLTGGLRTLPLLTSALANKHAHLLGVGRLAVLCPELPRVLQHGMARTYLSEPLPEPDLTGLGIAPPSGQSIFSMLERAVLSVIIVLWDSLPLELPKLVGAGTDMAWHIVMMRRIARGQDADFSVGGFAAVLRMWLWVAPWQEEDSLWDSYAWVVMGLVGVLVGIMIGMIY